MLVAEGVAVPWPEAVEDELAALPADPLPADPARTDLRDRLTFTIDPPDARDFDDALSVEREQGGLRVFVHIADVSAFVAAGGAIDREAAGRGCSVYLPGPGRADAAARALQRRLQPAAGGRPLRGHGRGRRPTASAPPTAASSAATTGSATRRWSGCWPGTSAAGDEPAATRCAMRAI